MMPQSTFAIRARGVTVAKNGRKNKTNAPPERATRGSQSGVAEARNATDTAIVTPKVRARPLRSRRTTGIGAAAPIGAERSFRKTSQTSPIDTARHAIATGSR